MQPSQPDTISHSDSPGEPPDDSAALPDFARSWESLVQVVSSIRRPSKLPDSDSYHEAITLEAIFELDERLPNGSTETILVVPISCQRCRAQKYFCSRARPTCTRCKKAGEICKPMGEGYQRLPRPKVRRQETGTARRNTSKTASSAAHKLPVGRLRRQVVRRSVSLPSAQFQHPDSISELSLTPGSKRRSLSPDSDFPSPSKKMRTSFVSRNKKSRASKVVSSKEAGTSIFPPSVVVSGGRDVLEWTFVRSALVRGKKQSGVHEHLPFDSVCTRTPRVWTNSLGGLLAAFPELAKAPAGFSWIQSGTPVLSLGGNDDQGHWMSTTALSINLSWDFSCRESELESIIEPDVSISNQTHSLQPTLRSAESTFVGEAEMEFQPSHSSLKAEASPNTLEVSPPVPMFSMGGLPEDSISQQQLRQDTLESHSELYQTRDAPLDDPALLFAVDPPSLTEIPSPSRPPPSSLPNEFSVNATERPVETQPRIPTRRPPEVETLLNLQRCSIPLLVWMPRDSRLVPSNLPTEYSYVCMGYFFVSEVRHAVIRYHPVSSAKTVQGRVCWSIALHWTPGGEDAPPDRHSSPFSDVTMLHESSGDLLRPWWFDPTDASSQAGDTIPSYQADSKMQLCSFIPLDLIAKFRPSEAFPRGWFCRICGMINIQLFFRHQICQSSVCGSVRDKDIPKGISEPLSNCRSIYQSSTVVKPVNHIPPEVISHWVTWDDGMQSWVHSIRDGVSLCHIFTGNQEHLQEDASDLLEKIQVEALLRQEDSSGPYFTHTTRISHPSDGSEATVPGGTPDCVRTAYHTLCDFVLRYGEMEKPRFGEVRIQAWVISGSKRGGVFRANKCPVVIHSLGADVVLNFTPRGGYKIAEEPNMPDKGKGGAGDPDLSSRSGTPQTEPHVGPLSLDIGDDAPSTHGPEAGDALVIGKSATESATAMGTLGQRPRLSPDGVAVLGSDAPPSGPTIKAAFQGPTESRSKGTRKKKRVTKDKAKPSIPGVSITLVHGDCVVLCGDDFECQIGRTGTTILVIGFPEES